MLKYTCRNAIAMKKNTNLKESKENYVEGLGGRKGKERQKCQIIIMSQINNKKKMTPIDKANMAKGKSYDPFTDEKYM